LCPPANSSIMLSRRPVKIAPSETVLTWKRFDKPRSYALRRQLSFVARRIIAQSPVIRAIGCSTNSRQAARASLPVSGGLQGLNCDASN
jgi:hypothetical protein